MSKNRGSILLPILLVSTIALSIALAAASRSLKGLKSTGETEQSSSAYSAAEAGIEQALYSIEIGGMPSAITTPVPVGAGGYIKKLAVTHSGGGAGYLVEGAVATDDVTELKLDGYTGNKIVISWVNEEDPAQAYTTNPASLVITYVYGNSPYSIKKEAVNCILRSNGFLGPFPVHNEKNIGGGRIMKFACQYTFVLTGTPQIVRLRPMYNKAEIFVTSDPDVSSATLPPQSLTITATGQAGETERTVEVTRSKPSLPAIFDFVLFSGSASTPLQK